MDYEFRFFHKGLLEALHVTALADDTAATARAYAYFEAGPRIDYIEIRCGLRFMRRIENPEELKAASH